MISNITIPSPCQQSWQQMTPADNGRHCQSCCKTVVDFTRMTNDEILNYIGASTNICGRFDNDQLKTINSLIVRQKSLMKWRGFIAAASLVSLLPSYHAEAQRQVINHLHQRQEYLGSADSTVNIKIKGRIVDKDSNLPLQGVSVVLKGTLIGTQTAADGTFKLGAYSKRSLAVISCVGYKSEEMPLRQIIQNQDIKLETDNVTLNVVDITQINVKRFTCTMGAISVVIHKKIPFYLRWWYWLRHQIQHVVQAVRTII